MSNGSERKLLTLPATRGHTAKHDHHSFHRKLPQTSTCSEIAVLGDTNGDCVFDVEDVQFLQYYIGSPLEYRNDLTVHQEQALDPDLDGDSDGVDIDYLMKVLANKYRFLASFNSTRAPFTLLSTIRTALSEPASSAQTSVLYEIGTTRNDAAVTTFSTF